MKNIVYLFAIACIPNLGMAESGESLSTFPNPPSFIGWLEDLFSEPDKFLHRSTVFQFGIGLRSNVNLLDKAQELNQFDARTLTPALSLTLEKNIGNNIGVGITLGNRIWRVPKLNYQYRYYTGGLRATYHFNVMDKLDPYVGGAVSYHRVSLTNLERNTSQSKVTGSVVLGARYYLTEHLGGFFEIGNDAMSWFKAGMVFYLP
jgi:opacity protein-like surface antigen